MKLPIRFVSAFLFWLVASPAAALFEPVADERAIAADFFDPFFSQSLDAAPPTPFGAWDDQVVAGGAYIADQDSEAITSTRMAASGFADGFSEMGSALSTFLISFDVSVDTGYSLSGFLAENPVALNEASLVLSRGATVIFEAAANGDTQPFSTTGTLTPGSYELLAFARWDDNAEFLPAGSAEFDFAFDVVPEPGTGAMIACAALAALGLGRRR